MTPRERIASKASNLNSVNIQRNKKARKKRGAIIMKDNSNKPMPINKDGLTSRMYNQANIFTLYRDSRPNENNW